MRSPIDDTVFGVASLGRTLPAVSLALVLLFVALRPEASIGLGLLARLVYWSLHIGIGLGGLVLASLLIRRRWCTGWPLAMSVLVTGMVGSLAAAPAYWLAERWLPVPGGLEVDDWLDVFATRSPWHSIVAEWLEVLPLFLTSWVAINLPLILARPISHGPLPPDGSHERPEQTSSGPDPIEHSVEPDQRSALIDKLPEELGRDVVAISSDMHYLHVHTTVGRAMVLGNLKDAAAAFAEMGMMVHRSHWVAHAHVQHVHIAGKEASCRMSTGLRVPVSRRKRRDVREQYGLGQVVRHPATGKQRRTA